MPIQSVKQAVGGGTRLLVSRVIETVGHSVTEARTQQKSMKGEVIKLTSPFFVGSGVGNSALKTEGFRQLSDILPRVKRAVSGKSTSVFSESSKPLSFVRFSSGGPTGRR